MANFSQLMQRLDHEEKSKHVDSKVWLAFQQFGLSSNTASSYEDLVRVLVSFVQHMFSKLLGPVELPGEMAFGKVLELLGLRTLEPVYDSCRRGTNGGISAVLQRICEGTIKEMEEKYVAHALETFIDNPLDYDEVHDLMSEYYTRFGKYLPFQMRSVESLCMNWRQILLNHANILAKARNDVGKI